MENSVSEMDMLEARDLNKRVAHVEASQESLKNAQTALKETQDGIARDLKETSDALRLLTNDIGVLVNNVSHLTDAISNLHKIIDRTHKIEIDLVEMKSRTESINRLWDGYEDIKTKVDNNNVISSGVKFVLGAMVLAISAIVFNKIF